MTEQTEPTQHDRLAPLIASVTQREKFLLAHRLDKPYSELMEDPDRVMIALAWVKMKRENGGIGPNFDDLLDKTDQDLIDILGLGQADDDDQADDPKDAQS